MQKLNEMKSIQKKTSIDFNKDIIYFIITNGNFEKFKEDYKDFLDIQTKNYYVWDDKNLKLFFKIFSFLIYNSEIIKMKDSELKEQREKENKKREEES